MTSVSGKTFLVTGANSGVGRAASRRLAKRGAAVVMLCRSRERGDAARRAIERETGGGDVELLLADLADPDAVRSAVHRFCRRHDRLHGLINNAGIYSSRRRITPDGAERTLAVNHLGHFLLTNLLRPELENGAGRVVNVTSEMHRRARLHRAPLESILRGTEDYGGVQAYADSKLANILFTFELARRAEDTGVTANAVHPGLLSTRIWNRNRDIYSLLARLLKPFMGRPDRGGAAVAHVAGDPALEGLSGRYFDRREPGRASDAAYDPARARELWECSTVLTGLDG